LSQQEGTTVSESPEEQAAREQREREIEYNNWLQTYQERERKGIASRNFWQGFVVGGIYLIFILSFHNAYLTIPVAINAIIVGLGGLIVYALWRFLFRRRT
jgi:Flp pilus assembly protein TadB